MLLSDRSIRRLCEEGFPYWEDSNKTVAMIEPFCEPVSGGGKISYGVSSAGYDARLNTKIKIFKNTYGDHIDPKYFKDPDYCKRVFDDIEIEPNTSFTLQPHQYILAETFEYFRIPRNIAGRCTGKSTLARCQVLINTTPLEPEWEGKITLEIGNVGCCPAHIYCMQGICQVQFEMLSELPEISYFDKRGIYQRQREITVANVRE